MNRKILLQEKDIPRQWYNIAADLPTPPLPPLAPDGRPITPDMLAPVFPMNLIEQEVSTQRWIDIPEEILDILYQWRPTPLRRAERLERYLGTPAKIYYKDESVSPPGSHKPNTAVPQAWYNKQFGIERLTTETGAGQWGSALAFACKLVGLECKVFMVRISFEQKPYRKLMMQVWGANCVASPSSETKAGRDILSKFPDTPGSLGIAISEAIEQAVTDPTGKTRYSLGSVLNHVMLHQTIIGLEAKAQLKSIGEKLPDTVIACAGGGSNFAGLAFPFTLDKINGAEIEIIPVEPTACPTMTRGPFAYDFGDTAGMTPLLAMFTLGHAFVPPPIHAGGLRYHGMAPLVCQCIVEGLHKPRSIDQVTCYEAAFTWARTEGFICAPETSHAIACAIQEAQKAKEEGKEKVILFNYSGHGLMDLSGYDAYLSGKLTPYALPEEELQKTENCLKDYPKAEIRKSGKW
ncbi:MAG TPA: TrpB-like pyridoxal phosphate-dependent enzyme [Anaerohalosphaeraceae bacterium]|nr:TrpB-like pyridoxal phosphate-dependent enzyme [Anaerohalosphaeraceae bacterium]HPB93838.1 TrpB-like pyridoxal phosphate-dependent enzyme [Anaerohalosphaeraceae bacterium]HRT24306.1 TrpB-like pyridoxal phosphate-dependent enzyme [Anaerohalosphaeraceae bacterium]HRU14119.1 TrpB-like pyridoxal phosphate-dependent enzyme [Anaerohalosphaeraceae bacterium]